MRPGGRARKRPRKPSRDQRRDEVEDREERGETDRDNTLTGCPVRGHNPGPDPHRHPRRHDEHRGKGADCVEETLTTGDCDRQEPDVDEDQESEEERRTRTVRGDGGEVESKQERHRRRDQRRFLDALTVRVGGGAARSARKHEPRNRRQREQKEDAHRERHAAVVQELEDPSPLINRRQDERQDRQHRPALRAGHLREPDVQQQQVREERDRAVLAGREECGRRKAAEQAQHRDEEGFAPDRQQHRDQRDHREQAKCDERRNQVPERVRSKEGREENRDRRRVHRVGGRGVPARCLHLADDEQCDCDQNADRDPDRRLQPPGLDRVLQEEHGRHDQRDARDRREQLHADETLPVERRRGRPAGGSWRRRRRSGRPRHQRRRRWPRRRRGRRRTGRGWSLDGPWRRRRRWRGRRGERTFRDARLWNGQWRRRRNWPVGRGRRRRWRHDSWRHDRRHGPCWLGPSGRSRPRGGRRRWRRLARQLGHARTKLVDLLLLRLDHAQKRIQPSRRLACRHPGRDRQNEGDDERDQREEENLHCSSFSCRRSSAGLRFTCRWGTFILHGADVADKLSLISDAAGGVPAA